MLWLILLLIFVLHGLVLSFFVLLEHRHPTSTLAWILALIFVPFFGALAYYLFGRMRFSRQRRKRARSLGVLGEHLEELAHPKGDPNLSNLPWWEAETAELLRLQSFSQTEHTFAKSETNDLVEVGEGWASSAGSALATTQDERFANLIALAHRVSNAQVSNANAITLLQDGKDTFEALEKAILSARQHIHVCYYIIRPDDTGRWLRDLLIKKAEEGVEIRLLYDAIGSYALSEDFWSPLRVLGAKIGVFLPIRFQYRLGGSHMNFRNHRKIVVVDGVIGFTGGLNIGDEYRGELSGHSHWRDTHLMLHGPAVRDLQLAFGEDWYHTTEETLAQERYFPSQIPSDGNAQIQIIPSGPDEPWDSLHLIFFVAIANARERVWITTPYFVPNDAILTALKTSALRGVDVRLLVPEQSDERLVWFAGRSYYRDLLRAGVRIYEYTKGVLHAKSMCVDGVFGTVGSANMDIRSFQLNFELNALIYSSHVAQQMEATFLEDLQSSHEVDLIGFLRRPLSQRLMEAGARLMSPLL
ncbi:MAG: cardiolipin synthase [Myxococcales bacterium]|nr:cardiolipin synthase [Myxococcales bacterium]MCB9644293.1 cardiolipin synthase [Myxococcales bacterium]